MTTIDWTTISCQAPTKPLSSKKLPVPNDACGEHTATSPCDELDKPSETRELNHPLQTKTERHARAVHKGESDSDGASNNHHKHFPGTGKNTSFLSDESNDQALRDGGFVHFDESLCSTAFSEVSPASRYFQHDDDGAETSPTQPADSEFISAAFSRGHTSSIEKPTPRFKPPPVWVRDIFKSSATPRQSGEVGSCRSNPLVVEDTADHCLYPIRSTSEALVESDKAGEDKLPTDNPDLVNGSLDETASKINSEESDDTSSDETPAYDSDYNKGKERGTTIHPKSILQDITDGDDNNQKDLDRIRSPNKRRKLSEYQSVRGTVPNLPPPESVRGTGEADWPVKRILDSRVIGRQLHYLVLWRSTWEPARRLSCDELVAAYHNAHPSSPKSKAKRGRGRRTVAHTMRGGHEK